MDELYNTNEGIPAEWEDAMRRRFLTYMWYRSGVDSDGNKIRRCWCSYCGRHFEVDSHSRGLYADLWSGRHNTTAMCPECGEPVQMIAEGKMRSYSSLDAKGRAVCIKTISPERVLLRCFYLEMTYTADAEQGSLQIFEDARYLLRPGEVKAIRKKPYSSEWTSRGISEPWPIRYAVWISNASINYYAVINPEELEKSFLKYSEVDDFADCITATTSWGNSYDRPAYVKYLCLFCLYPQLEGLMKHGCYNIVSDLVYHNLKNGCFLNWKRTDPAGFCKMPKSDAKKWIADGAPLRVRELMEGLKVNYTEACKISICTAWSNLKEVADNWNVDALQIARYLVKQHEGIFVLKDYWRAAQNLGRDLSVPSIRFPKHLHDLHDEMTAAERRLREEKEALKRKAISEKYMETYRNYRTLYEYYEDDLAAVVPEMLSDISIEGRMQHHCVAGYIDRHASGKTIIIFLRNPMYPMIPKYTAEISPEGELRQVQGYNNKLENAPDEAAREFIDRWLNEVGRRIRKAKKESEETAA